MGGRNRHLGTGNNQPEYCPLCLLFLKARFSAASHFAAHARRGELEEREGVWTKREWRYPDDPHMQWFSRGFHFSRYSGVELERQRDNWLRARKSHHAPPLFPSWKEEV